MADQQQQSGAISAAFPAPPPFYKHFTEQNLSRLKELQQKAQSDDQGITQLYPSQPPAPPPATSTIATTTVTNSTSEWTFDHAFHLRKLAKSLLLNFLELIGTLAVNPEHYGRKIEDLRTLFINMHHLINEYRPHQARESLIMMMEEQVERCRAEVRGIRQVRGKVKGILDGLKESSVVGMEEVGEKEMEGEQRRRRREEEDRRVWEALERELGDGATGE
ncbi:Mediator of RNA polymerase II transcription subunit 7 [Acarospora aff. strigata]|nr:Mediator of RNA polymerase II transcription subunit 7 [Acarospora aff. strigata]